MRDWLEPTGCDPSLTAGADVQASEVLARFPGLVASTGSACHADSFRLAPVLATMGVPTREGMGAACFSLGRTTTWNELERVLALIDTGPGVAG